MQFDACLRCWSGVHLVCIAFKCCSSGMAEVLCCWLPYGWRALGRALMQRIGCWGATFVVTVLQRLLVRWCCSC